MSQQVRHWYVSRDGHQYGPFTNEELGKRFELARLQPTDLVWRPGLPGWRPAGELFPQLPINSLEPASGTKDQVHPRVRVGKVVERRAAPADSDKLVERSDPWRRRILIAATALICSAAVGAISGYVFRHFAS